MRRPGNPVQRFEAPTIFEAYTKLKRGMGENAVILKTRTYRKGSILGLWGQKVVEITAAPGALPPRERKAGGALARVYGLKDEAPAAPKTPGGPAKAPPPAAPAPEPPPQAADVRKELAEIREMVREIQEAGRFRHWPDLPPEFQKAFQKLQGYNIHEDIARALVQRWHGHYPDYAKGMRVDVSLLERYVGEMVVPGGGIRVKGGGKPTVVMLVGPTGVGKTTTLAKLAVHHKMKEGLKVGLATIDTYRIAAVEQLRTYAGLLNLPIRVVSTEADMRAALAAYADLDLVLVDTAGRAPHNKEGMAELRRYVEVAEPDELHLVLSVSVHNDVMRDTLEQYDRCHVHKVLLTKLDEAVHYGVILTVLARTQRPIGYLTTGQKVPEDVEVATSRRLARLILGLDRVHA